MVRVSWELRILWERKVVWTVSLINLAPSQYGHIISRFQYTLTKVMDGVDCTCAYPGGIPVQSILGVMPCMVEHLEHLLLSLTLCFLNISCFCLSVSATHWAFSLCALLIVFCLSCGCLYRTLNPHSFTPLISSLSWASSSISLSLQFINLSFLCMTVSAARRAFPNSLLHCTLSSHTYCLHTGRVHMYNIWYIYIYTHACTYSVESGYQAHIVI